MGSRRSVVRWVASSTRGRSVTRCAGGGKEVETEVIGRGERGSREGHAGDQGGVIDSKDGSATGGATDDGTDGIEQGERELGTGREKA